VNKEMVIRIDNSNISSNQNKKGLVYTSRALYYTSVGFYYTF